VVLSCNLLDGPHLLNHIRQGREKIQPGLNALWKSLVNLFQWNKSDQAEAAAPTDCRPAPREPVVRGRKHMTRYPETSIESERTDSSNLVQSNSVLKDILALPLFWTAMTIS
jgi:hypothetical protein